jgi:hypothetical protein
MAKLILEIEDKKLKFFKEILQNFSFVKIEEDEYEEDTDEQVKENIRAGVKELKEVLEGKKESRPAKDFLKEL